MNIILILGGSGYVGTELIKELIKKNKVINYDLDLFGSDHLPYSSKNFLHIRGDIRDINKIKKVLKIYKPDICFHLACISNDPSFLLNENLSKEINYDSFKDFLKVINNTSLNKLIFPQPHQFMGF